jgi:hypothetical protein
MGLVDFCNSRDNRELGYDVVSTGFTGCSLPCFSYNVRYQAGHRKDIGIGLEVRCPILKGHPFENRVKATWIRYWINLSSESHG